jgi:hypothetical protein
VPVISCDPWRVWSRLEPRPRQLELDGVLEARVQDALWMLTRQWQFGEFHGEDAGSAVMAMLARRLSPVVEVRVGSAKPEAYDPTVPLEARVERLPITFPAPLRAQIARHLMAVLSAALGASADLTAYRRAFVQAFPLRPAEADPDDEVAQARLRVAGLGGRVHDALAGRTFDGVAVAEWVRPGLADTDLPPDLATAAKGEETPLLEALQEFRGWFTRLYLQPTANAATGWAESRLEYDYEVTVAREQGAGLRLAGASTPSGRVDWYCFDVSGTTKLAGSAAPGTEVTSVIPGQVEFAGMPNQRWWQFEDAAVSLGHLRADTTDLAKILVTDFALLYGNNWLCVPYAQPVGTLAEITGIVVTDVFGRRTLVRAATGAAGDDWSRWDLFSLSHRVGGLTPLGQHLFLPPALPTENTGPVLEEAAFLRDEGANMVWAVETRIPDGLGGGRDGADVARRLAKQLAAALAAGTGTMGNGTAGTGTGTGTTGNGTAAEGLRYVLGTTVPENWIPFVPVHTGEDYHSIRLQRAWLPRPAPSGSRVRPVTEILRHHLSDDDTPTLPYYVNEEEVPRIGVRVRAAMQRARWTDGSTVVWHSRQALSGRGEGASGLRFDVLERPE